MKRFEDEYKKYLKENTPDLWDQIEAGITAKERKENVQEQESFSFDTYRGKNDLSKTENRTPYNKRRFIRSMVSAAAGICILVTAAVTLTLRQNASKNQTESVSETAEAVYHSDAKAEVTAKAAYDTPVNTEKTAAENYSQPAMEMSDSEQEYSTAMEMSDSEQEYSTAMEMSDSEQEYSTDMEMPALEQGYLTDMYQSADKYEEEISPEKMTTEDFVNHFSYDLPEPAAGSLVNVTAETAECPWNDELVLLMIFLNGERDTTAVSNETLQAGKELKVSLDIELSSERVKNFRCITAEDPKQLLFETTLHPGENSVFIYELQLQENGNKDDSAASLDVIVNDLSSETGEPDKIMLNDINLTETPDQNFLLAAAAVELSLVANGDDTSGVSIENVLSIAETLDQNEPARRELLEFAELLKKK